MFSLVVGVRVLGFGVWDAGGLQGVCRGMEHQCPDSPVSWFGLSMRRGGPCLLGCTIMWGELAHVGRYDLRFRESQEPQGPLGEAKSHT